MLILDLFSLKIECAYPKKTVLLYCSALYTTNYMGPILRFLSKIRPASEFNISFLAKLSRLRLALVAYGDRKKEKEKKRK